MIVTYSSGRSAWLVLETHHMKVYTSSRRHHHGTGGYFIATMDFPQDYPHRPPEMRFISEMWHPNGMYMSFTVHQQCIPMVLSVYLYYIHLVMMCMGTRVVRRGGALWTRYVYNNNNNVQVESIIVSVQSMLSSPNCDSPANVEAAVCIYKSVMMMQKEFRDDYPAFRKHVMKCVRLSQEATF